MPAIDQKGCNMSFDFILMLTSDDRTIRDARARVDEALEGGVRHIGFKDVGLPFGNSKRSQMPFVRLAAGLILRWSALMKTAK